MEKQDKSSEGSDAIPEVLVHTFANGIRVPQDALLSVQRDRYETLGSGNVHEPEEEAWFQTILEQTGDTGTYVDVGAAIGYYVALVLRSKLEWKVISLEPNPDMRVFLSQTLDLNSIDRAKVYVIPKALYDKDGSAPFRLQSFGSAILENSSRENGHFDFLKRALMTIVRPLGKQNEGEVLNVPTLSFRALAREAGGPIDLLKMDIQGGERTVVPAAEEFLNNGAVKWLIIGTHGDKAHDACIRTLRQKFEIVDDRRVVRGQPDGLIVARFRE
ncbi:FkbM family methyltransferase [Sulfitobacter sp. JL08]|uniref:FkbM family methyltransferase n=1 Tax=Sulfitobacter sp. JL08 TaxID=2070369 RepID=UPI0013B381CC|nr:FkbM family methyltransferase [Sulfitobacter sp. JL08]